MYRLHQKVPANEFGRDFIVGDLHGCLDLLEIELVRVQFDPAIDRLFSVGDLIYRGHDSMGCLRLLLQPWFYAVRGNHETMLLEYFHALDQPYSTLNAVKMFFQNGGRWVAKLSDRDQDELRDVLLPRVARLPYVLTVGEGDAQFHVAHAELMMGAIDPHAWLAELAGIPEDRANERILTDDLITDSTLEQMPEPLTWGRRLIKRVDFKRSKEVVTPAGNLLISQRSMHPGLSLTYVGHTPLSGMVLHESHLFIDRGAYERKGGSSLLLLKHGDVRLWGNEVFGEQDAGV